MRGSGLCQIASNYLLYIMKNKILLLGFVAFATMCTAQFDEGLATTLQEILIDRVQNGGNNGVSACVIMPNGDMWTGQAGDGLGTDITDTTVFHAASVTKTNMATLFLLLAEDGLVNLDAPWTQYITLNSSFNENITLRQLLSNISGIADYLEIAGVGDLVLEDPNHFFTSEELIEDIVSEVPDFAPGTDFHYSSSNFVLAGMIAEAITGNPVQDEFRTRIWEPLALQHTYYGGYDDYTEPRAGVWWNFGDGLMNYNLISETSMLSFGYGCSNIVSTPHDMAIFIHALLTGQILSPSSLNEMMVFSPESFDDWSAGYGMGLHHAIGTGTYQVLGHDGYYTNMSSVFHSMNHDFTVATMTNTQTTWYGIFNPVYDAVLEFLETGISSPVSDEGLYVFPNPASTQLFISAATSGVYQLKMLDCTGKVAMEVDALNDKDAVLDVSQLATGIYSVVLFWNDDVMKKTICIAD